METILPPLIPVLYVVFLVLERVFPARPLPKVRFWYLKGFFFFALTGGVTGAVSGALTKALGGLSAFHVEPYIGVVPAALVAALLGDALWYAVHRTLHRVPFLWRWTHQMHHSAERIDVPGSALFHPFDLVVMSVPPALIAALLGVSPDAATLAGFLGFLLGTFQHLNVRTPQWLGWFIERPEAHSVHHARGVHAYNYGNFPIWDILLGTFRNPAAFTGPAGFWDGASKQMGAMLIGRDVADPPSPQPCLDAVTT
jgi:sterol desaturase/sphingolipid hydroxylase (fatty acid hydroxylase superfamily)